MVDHHSTEAHDPELPTIDGHYNSLIYVRETKWTGLHCGGCGWSGGSFKGRWAEKHIEAAWARHVAFVKAGGVIEHGRASNVDEGVCRCVSCMIPWRSQQNVKRAAS